ncbi:hypothetical protein HZS_6362 [Henneguya salminicola]|nr:hypothetical protein HZS_6362 [Henneguya salminicola]
MRIALGPITSLFIINQNYKFAISSMIFAGLTDYFDGYIARRFPSQKSHVGYLLDSFADKIYMTFLASTLTYVGSLPIWLAAVIISRDILLIGGSCCGKLKIRTRVNSR